MIIINFPPQEPSELAPTGGVWGRLGGVGEDKAGQSTMWGEQQSFHQGHSQPASCL